MTYHMHANITIQSTDNTRKSGSNATEFTIIHMNFMRILRMKKRQINQHNKSAWKILGHFKIDTIFARKIIKIN